MKNANKIYIITVIFFLITSILVVFFIFQQGKPKTDSVVAIDNTIYEEEGREYDRSLPTINEGGLNLLFFGDIMLDRNVKNKINKLGTGYLISTSSLEQFNFKNYNLIAANLEGATTNLGEHYKPIYSNDFSFAPDDVLYFKNIGFNFFTIANNHLADQGERGIIETRENLQKLGINYTGCEDRKVGECSFKTLAIGGKKVSMVGLSMVYGQFDRQQADEIIKKLASSSDLVIVNIHWGSEYEHQFNKLQQTIGYELIDAGADLIIGHHPHVVQGMEVYESKLVTTNGEHPNFKKGIIFYSLGNFIFDQYFSVDTQEGLSVSIEVGADGNRIMLLPIKSKSSQASLMPMADKAKFLKKFISWSKLSSNYDEQITSGELFIN